MRRDIRNRRAKASQAAKLAQIRAALIAAGFDTTAKQARVLALGRSTAWAFLNRDEKTGGTAKVIKRILASPDLPIAVRRKVEEYVSEKSSGLYGHTERQVETFRNKLRKPHWQERRSRNLPRLSHAGSHPFAWVCWPFCAIVSVISVSV